MREELKQYAIRGIKGINQQERLADPELELADARNLWAPNGRLEKRPGYWGVGITQQNQDSSSTVATIYKEDPVGTFAQTATLDALPVGSRWYMSFNALELDSVYPRGMRIVVSGGGNTNNVLAFFEYWNGNVWAPLNTIEYNQASLNIESVVHLSTANNGFGFNFPRDLAKLSLAGTNSYWIRATLQNAGDTAFSGTIAITSVTFRKYSSSGGAYQRLFMVPVFFMSGTKYIAGFNVVNSPGWSAWQNSELRGYTHIYEFSNTLSTIGLVYPTINEEPATVATIPQFSEAYISYGRIVTVHKEKVRTDTGDDPLDAGTLAVVETDPAFVGPGADYDSAFVPQLGTWPAAQCIAFHRGELWAANFLGGPQQIRWSAAAPAYKVWPVINTDVLTDSDESPIIGLYPFNQNMFVFKERSIWQMVYTGLNDQKLNTYRGEKVVSGIGCVAQNSIQDIHGQLVFLGADGIYRFNGVQAERISDRVTKTLNGISSSKKHFATSVHWSEKSLYLLAINTKGDKGNDTLVVWDYKNDSWWIWDDFNVVSFFIEGRINDKERVYFLDQGDRLFELGVGVNDNGGAITAYGVTQRLADVPETKRLRLIDPRATNTSRSLKIEVQANDAPFEGLNDTSISFVDSNEKSYQVAIYNADKYTAERDRRSHIASLASGEWFRLKFTHDEQYAPLVLNEIIVAPVDVGRRA